MQDFSLQITKSRKSVQRNEERVREGEKRIALWKLPPLVEIRKPSGFPQRLGKHKTLSTVPTRPTCILFFKTLREARSTLNTLLFGPKDGEHLTLCKERPAFFHSSPCAVSTGLPALIFRLLSDIRRTTFKIGRSCCSQKSSCRR